ncbi:MAG: polysaccharide biosynthesis tyrosine autokinase [Bacteroidaceae bacterium]|nr:polysaccharide biosynthesis tyrosine autokinase [Bacteroidaceae bacterium]
MINHQQEQDNDFNLNLMLFYIIRYWKYFLLSVFVCFVVAFFYLRCTTNVYNATAKVLLQDKEKGTFSSQVDVLSDFGYQGVNTSVENEIEMLCSKSVVQGAVLNAGLYVKYSIDDFYVDKPIYKENSPVQVAILEEDLMKLQKPLFLHLKLNEDSIYSVSYEYNNEMGELTKRAPVAMNEYPYLLETEKGELLLSDVPDAPKYKNITIVVHPITSMTSLYKGALSVQPVSKTASVATILVRDVVPMNGVDFINSLIVSYNRQKNDDKQLVARKTKEFIDGRIDEISSDLAKREKTLADYKRDQQLINPTIDAPRVLESKSAYTKQLEAVNLSIEQVQFLLDYVKDGKNALQAVPVAGMESNSALLSVISKYNTAVSKRNDLQRTATDENPMMIAITEEVRSLHGEIRESLESMKKSLLIQKESLSKLAERYSSRIAQTPAIESKLSDLSRERDIKSQLYVMLLQKYEENALAMAVTSDNLKCIDPASASFAPVSPRRSLVFLIALVVGLAIPSLFLYLKELLRTKIESLSDLERLTDIPIVGSVPLNNKNGVKKSSIVVKENNNDVMMEAFRSIRTNMQFLIKKNEGKVIMFTSTTSGEGKTFVSSNLAVSQALLGKKVLLIGLDVRCPRLSEVFDIHNRKEGITSFLISSPDNTALIDKLVVPSGVSSNLDILPSGIIPPNPAELLASDNLDIAIEYFKKKYDYIIIDTAPVGLVTDSIIMSRVANAVVYVVRAKYTEKGSLDFISSLISDNKLKNVSIVFNAEDLDSKSKYGKYKYGYSYYGFGYGNEN